MRLSLEDFSLTDLKCHSSSHWTDFSEDVSSRGNEIDIRGEFWRFSTLGFFINQPPLGP
jgi:hypothetical protein